MRFLVVWVGCIVVVNAFSPLCAEETAKRSAKAVTEELAEVKQVLEKLSLQVSSLERELKHAPSTKQGPPQDPLFAITYRVNDLARHIVGDFATAVTFDHLVGYITTHIAPQQWGSAGGRGTIRVHDQSLIVAQTAEVHAELSRWLERIREAKATVNAFELGQWPTEEPELAATGFDPKR